MRKGLVGAVAGAVALGAGIGMAAERYAVGRTRLRPDPEADEPFFRLPADRTRSVVADDGVALHVEEVGPQDAPLTVVLCHGYTQEMAVWHYQRRALSRDDSVRAVYWDQRSAALRPLPPSAPPSTSWAPTCVRCSRRRRRPVRWCSSGTRWAA